MKIYILPVLVLLSILVTPDTVSAQGLVPACSGNSCGTCDLIVMANSIVSWLITMLAVVFAALMVVAGFGLVTSGGNQSALDAAKSKFTNGIVGFIIVLAAYLIVDTFMAALLRSNGGSSTGFGPWSEVTCSTQAASQQWVETSPEPAGSVPTETPPSGTGSGTALSQSQAEARLREAGISIKPGAGLEGIRSTTLDGVIALRNACGCSITVTEGTGGTHSNGTYSHANGYKLDLRTRDNPTLVNYIRNNYQPAGTWSDGTPLYRNGNATYAIEGDHIDVVYRP